MTNDDKDILAHHALFPHQREMLEHMHKVIDSGQPMLVTTAPRDHGRLMVHHELPLVISDTVRHIDYMWTGTATASISLMLLGQHIPAAMPEYADPLSRVEKNMIAHSEFLDNLRRKKTGNKY
jgi:hypothetical protein